MVPWLSAESFGITSETLGTLPRRHAQGRACLSGWSAETRGRLRAHTGLRAPPCNCTLWLNVNASRSNTSIAALGRAQRRSECLPIGRSG